MLPRLPKWLVPFSNDLAAHTQIPIRNTLFMLSTGDQLHGFTVEGVTELPDIRSTALRLQHNKSGARALHLHNADTENLLALAFRTPPPDHTGLPHILEHTVLCGSKQFPVKDPFVELLKTSLATFLNAMTYSDKTVYPCASMVERDFFNLAGVYCDAVFQPLITEKHFKQEGHHFDFAEAGNPASDLIIKGIVFNEMKGAYSDLDGIIHRDMGTQLCPDNAYGFDSGGNPEYIPNLTYEKFVNFHHTYYHPSNSFIFIFGNIPTEKHLEFLNERLCGFDRIEIDTSIAQQPRWREPRHTSLTYPVGMEDETAGKTAVVMTFLTNDVTDALSALSMNVLDYYLVGNAASPLRKALEDSKLGEALTSSGYLDWQRDTLFTIGLKGSEKERADEIVKLVHATCSKVVEDGLDKEKVEAAFHSLELSFREIKGMYPLDMMDRVYNSWIYDADPLYHLRLNEHLAELRKRFATEEGFLEAKLRELILDNPHYTVSTYTPDKEYMAKKERGEKDNLAKIKETLTDEVRNRIVREAAELDEMQSTPNSPAALATLPHLSLSDIPPEPHELNTIIETVDESTVLYTDVFANGINYLRMAFDLSGIDDDLIDYLSLYCEAFQKMGAGEDDYVRMAERQAASTGGIGAGIGTGSRIGDPDFVRPSFTLSSKAIDAKLCDMLKLVEQKVLSTDLTNKARLKDIILQGRVGRRSSIVPSGSAYAASYAARHLSRNCAVSERLNGISEIQLMDDIADHFEARHGDVVEKLERIRAFILGRGKLTTSFVGAEAQYAQLKDFLGGFLGKLDDLGPGEENRDFATTLGTREGIATPADVAFVARAWRTASIEQPEAAALLMLSVHLSYGYLWDNVRVKGGAYGCRAGYDSMGGIFSLSSYRDPYIKETLDVYTGLFDFITEQMDLSPAGIEQAIIGTVKTLDRPTRPGQAVGTALSRHRSGSTKKFRKDFRTRLLSLTGDDVRNVANDLLRPAFETSPISVLSSREKLTRANEALGEAAMEIKDI